MSDLSDKLFGKKKPPPPAERVFDFKLTERKTMRHYEITVKISPMEAMDSPEKLKTLLQETATKLVDAMTKTP